MRLPRSPAKNRAFGRASPSAARKARLNDPEVLRLVDYSEIERWLDTVMPGTRNAVEDLGVREPAPPLRLSGGLEACGHGRAIAKGPEWGSVRRVFLFVAGMVSVCDERCGETRRAACDGLRRSSRPCSASRPRCRSSRSTRPLGRG